MEPCPLRTYLDVAAAANDNILASTVGGGGHLAVASGHQVHIDVGAHEVPLTCGRDKKKGETIKRMKKQEERSVAWELS